MKVIIIGVGNGGTKLIGTLVHELLSKQGIWPYHYEPLFWSGVHGENGIVLNPDGLEEHLTFPLLPDASVTVWPWMENLISRLWGLAKFIRAGSRVRLFYDKDVKLIWITRELHSFLASMQHYQKKHTQLLPGWHHRPGHHYDDYERLTAIYPHFHLRAEEADRIAAETAWWHLHHQGPFKLKKTGKIYHLRYEHLCAKPLMKMEEIAEFLNVPLEVTPSMEKVHPPLHRVLQVNSAMKSRIDEIAGELNRYLYPEIYRGSCSCIKRTRQIPSNSTTNILRRRSPSPENTECDGRNSVTDHTQIKRGQSTSKLINVVYAHLQIPEFALHKKQASVIWSRDPVEGCDLYAYLDAFSYQGSRSGLDVLVMLEPIVVLPGEYSEEVWQHFDHILTFVDALADRGGKFQKIFWPAFGRPITKSYSTKPELSYKLPFSQKRNAICMINGNKQSAIPGELYSKRIEVAQWFYDHSDISFDVYGFPPFQLPNYRGRLTPYTEKFVMFAQYRYSLCFENIYDPFWSAGYLSEKLLDSLMSGTVPIYFGCSNVEDYIPQECFIDFRNFKDYSELDSFLRKISDSEYRLYMKHINQWVNDGNLSRFSMDRIYDKLTALSHLAIYNKRIDAESWKPNLYGSLTRREWSKISTSKRWSWDDLASVMPTEKILSGEFMLDSSAHEKPVDRIDQRGCVKDIKTSTMDYDDPFESGNVRGAVSPSVNAITDGGIVRENSRTILLSYPRSGSTWLRYCIEFLTKRLTIGYFKEGLTIENGIGKLTDIGVDCDKPPIVYRRHGNTPNEIASYDMDNDRLIFLIRNYKECMVRHNSPKGKKNLLRIFYSQTQGFRDGSLDYIGCLQVYDAWRGNKVLIYYEDLIRNPEPELLKVLNLLKVDKTYLNKLIGNLSEHRRWSLSLYDLTRQTEAEKSYTHGDADKLLFHSHKLTSSRKEEWDLHLLVNFPYLTRKYLERYRSPHRASKSQDQRSHSQEESVCERPGAPEHECPGQSLKSEGLSFNRELLRESSSRIGPTVTGDKRLHCRSKTILLSYPRSGNTWLRYCIEFLTKRLTEGYDKDKVPIEGGLGRFVDIGVDCDKPPIVFKRHGHTPNEKDFYDMDHDKLILLVRNYKECIVRHPTGIKDANARFYDQTQGYRNGSTDYIGCLEIYDTWRSKKVLIYYEDLIRNPESELMKVLNLLEADEKHLRELMDNLDFHKKQSVHLYAHDEKTRLSMSYTQGAPDKLLFHSKTLTEKQKREWDHHIHTNYPDLAGKYLRRYQAQGTSTRSENTLIGIVFSKDRPMQLDASLRSFALHCRDRETVSLKVVYTTSDPSYEKVYEKLISEHPFVEFIKEMDFKKDVLSLLSQDSYQHVLFLVDDNLFVKHFSLIEVVESLKRNPEALGFSLRLGRNTTYSFMLDKNQKPPSFNGRQKNVLKYDWTKSELDFGYPLELSSSVYRTRDLLPILNQVEFSNPNTLEFMLDTNKHLYENEKSHLLCYDHSVTFCNPLNVVQTAWKNRSGSRAEYTSESLAKIFMEGYRVDAAAYSGITPNACHQLAELKFFKIEEQDSDLNKENGRLIRAGHMDITFPEDGILPGQGVLGLVSIIILNLNGADHIRECIQSIKACTRPIYELIVVDNGSTDDSLDYLRALPDIKLIENKENVGAPYGRNQGLALAEGEYIVFLDNDTAVTKRWLERFISCANTHPNYGVLGPMSNYVSGPQLVEDVNYGDYNELQAFARDWGKTNANKASLAGRLILFCLFVKREVIKKIGGIDTAYRKWGWEDDDFCIRAQIAGYRLVIVKDVYIHHTGSQTARTARIDYDSLMEENWKVFRNKWQVGWKAKQPMSYRVDQIIAQPFDQERHAVPIPPRSEVEKRLYKTHQFSAEKEEASSSRLRAGFIRQGPNMKALQDSLNRFSGELVHIPVWTDVATLNDQMNQAKYLLLLAPDMIATRNWLENLFAVAESDESIAVVGPMSNAAPSFQRVRPKYKSLKKELQKFAARRHQKHNNIWNDVPYLAGFCLLLKNKALREVGGFNVRLPLPHALWELYRRLRDKGFKLASAQGVYVHHNELTLDEGAEFEHFQLLEEQVIQGEKSFSEGRHQEAEEIFRDVLKHNPYQSCAHNNLACLLWQSDRREEALEEITRAMEIDPDNKDTVWNLGQVLQSLGLAQDARQVYDSYLKRHPEEQEMANAMSHLENSRSLG